MPLMYLNVCLSYWTMTEISINSGHMLKKAGCYVLKCSSYLEIGFYSFIWPTFTVWLYKTFNINSKTCYLI